MKILKLFLIITINTSLFGLTIYQQLLKEQLIETETVSYPLKFIEKSIKDRNILLFVSLIKKVKTQQISKEILISNKEKLIKLIDEQINEEKEFFQSFISAKEIAKISGFAILSLGCVGLGIVVAIAGASNKSAFNNAPQIAGGCFAGSGLSIYAGYKTFNRNQSSDDHKKLVKIKKLLQAIAK